MVLVMCRVDQREYSFLTFLMQEINRLVLRLEFRSITLLELGPLCDVGVLTETPVQLSARGDLLEPLVELSVFLRQISGPKRLDKKSETVLGGRLFVGTFKLDHARRPLLECFGQCPRLGSSRLPFIIMVIDRSVTPTRTTLSQ